MTRSLRTFAAVFLAVLTLATGITLAQSQPGAAKVKPRIVAPGGGNAPQPAAPAAKPDPQQQIELQRQAELRRQLEIVLRNWEISSAKIKTLDGEHIRSRSNSVFATDARAKGKFHFEAPDKGRIDLTGDPPKKGAVSPKKTKEGVAYSLTADRDEKWICDGKQVLMIDEVEKQYEAIPLPPEMQGANIIESPLPFLFGMKAAVAKKRFQMELIQYDEERKLARITALPLEAKDAQNFIRADIVLDTEKYLPKFVSLVDPAGTITTQYVFEEVNVNNAGVIAKIQDWGRDPFKPNLKSYKLVQPPPVEQLGGPVPGGAKNKIIPLNGQKSGPAFPLQPGAGNTRPNNGAVVPRNGTSSGSASTGQRPVTR